MARQARLEAPEVLQHVMARGIERRKIFFDDEDYQFFKERLGKLVLDTKMDCLAWAFLPIIFTSFYGPTRFPFPYSCAA